MQMAMVSNGRCCWFPTESDRRRGSASNVAKREGRWSDRQSVTVKKERAAFDVETPIVWHGRLTARRQRVGTALRALAHPTKNSGYRRPPAARAPPRAVGARSSRLIAFGMPRGRRPRRPAPRSGRRQHRSSYSLRGPSRSLCKAMPRKLQSGASFNPPNSQVCVTLRAFAHPTKNPAPRRAAPSSRVRGRSRLLLRPAFAPPPAATAIRD